MVLLELLVLSKSLQGAFAFRSFYRKLLTRILKDTPLFDEVYYLENNPDVAQIGVPPLVHYIQHGDTEGRSPMPFFDPSYYRSHAKDKAKRINSLAHYTLRGRYLRLPTSPWFDTDYYLINNKDVALSDEDPLLHYLAEGGFQGRSPSPHFDGLHYLNTYPHVQSLHINPLLHYLYYGRQEGLKPLPEAKVTHFIAQNEAFDQNRWESLPKLGNVVNAKVDVVVPVYMGRNETIQCLHSVLSSTCKTPFELIVIDDDSPDIALKEQLRKLAGKGLFKLIPNSVNRGFVHTANRGMSLHKDRDVVLLNSDTEVYHDWLDRLADAAYRGENIATVTPLSNNATICSYPRFLYDNPYPLEISHAKLDGLCAQLNQNIMVEAPTAVGFCMYIRRACLNDIGEFDEAAFEKGYGEENDFCQRAKKASWKNMITADTFVRHWGGCSFRGEKARRVQNALKIINARYPDYDRQVKEFIKQDPLSEARAALDWNRLFLMKKEKNVLIINHNRGGGAERRVYDNIRDLHGQGIGVFLMRPCPGKPEMAYLSHPKIKTLSNLQPFKLDDTALFTKYLKDLGISEIHSHSFVDYAPDAPEQVVKVIENLDLYWVANLHDYKIICPQINVANVQGVYCGEPGPDVCNKCLKDRKSIFGTTTITAWREKHERLLQSADEVIVPSHDMYERLKKYFTHLPVTIMPHEDLLSQGEGSEIRSPKIGINQKLRIVVIGAIGKLKGFNVLMACAKHAKQNQLPLEFILLGYSMNDYFLEEAGVEITGKYQESEAREKLRKLKPDVVWLPSVWPETYSYTLSLALEANLPVFAFDLGAIAERLRLHEKHQLLMDLSLHSSPEKINELFIRYRADNLSINTP